MNHFKEMEHFSRPTLDSLTFVLMSVWDKTRTKLLSGIFSGW